MFSDLPKGQIASGVFFASFPSTAMFDSTKKALSLFAISVCCSASAQSFLRRTYPSHLDIVATIDKNEVSSRYALRSRNDSVAREKANRESAARKIEAGR